MSERVNNKLFSVEKTLNSKISSAKHIIYGLGITISKIPNASDAKINELINHFDLRQEFDDYAYTPLIEFIFIRAEDENPNSIESKICLSESSNEPFKIVVSPIRRSKKFKEKIIPISMRIVDDKNNYIGTLCSGLLVNELNKKLSIYFDPKNLRSINLTNVSKENVEAIAKNAYPEDLSNFVGNLIEKDTINVYYKFLKYPISLELKVSHGFFKRIVLRNILLFSTLFTIFILILIGLKQNVKKNYDRPLTKINNKILSLNSALDENERNFVSLGLFEEHSFVPKKLFEDLDVIIDNYCAYVVNSLNNHKQRELLEKKFLDLIFIEQHFSVFQKTSINEDTLFLNKLRSLVTEESVKLRFNLFFRQLINYCEEYYHELRFNYMLDPKNNHEISFKQSALIETIFNTLNFILRSAAFDEELFFELVYKEENAFPLIVIKVRISEGEKLGWEQGPLFAHSSLLTIHLLAKENNLFFNISKVGGFMHFIYEPIQEKLEEFSSVN